MNGKKSITQFFSDFLRHGGAGVLASIVIILIFLLCATWLKSLFFGILLAIVLLPLERKFFDKVFTVEKEGLWERLKKKFHKMELPEQEIQKRLRQKRVSLSSFAAIFTFCLSLVLVIVISFAILFPLMAKMKNSVVEWGKKSPTVAKVEKYLQENRKKDSKDEKNTGTLAVVRSNLITLAKENKELISSFTISSGKGIFTAIFNFAKGLGILLLDIALSIFFGFYFLQKIAWFESGEGKRRIRLGEWIVNLFFNSPWLPSVSQETKTQTNKIITHIGTLLYKWAVGYFYLILIEFILYSLLFSAIGVPYPLLASSIAGISVLLPFIGPLISIVLTAGLCIAYCESGVLFITLLFAGITYLLINGLLEQFILYPKFIGQSTGLTTIETIIVVLIGGIVAGIAGMIFAVPAAAVIKYIVPVIYKASSEQKEIE